MKMMHYVFIQKKKIDTSCQMSAFGKNSILQW